MEKRKVSEFEFTDEQLWADIGASHHALEAELFHYRRVAGQDITAVEWYEDERETLDYKDKLHAVIEVAIQEKVINPEGRLLIEESVRRIGKDEFSKRVHEFI